MSTDETLCIYVYHPVLTLQAIWHPYDVSVKHHMRLSKARAVCFNKAMEIAARLQDAGFSVALRAMPGDVDYCPHHWCSMNRAWVSEELAIHEGRSPRPFTIGVLSN